MNYSIIHYERFQFRTLPATGQINLSEGDYWVEVFNENSGSEVKIAELGASEFFGEMSLFEKDDRSCTVRTPGNAKS